MEAIGDQNKLSVEHINLSMLKIAENDLLYNCKKKIVTVTAGKIWLSSVLLLAQNLEL